MNSQNLKNNIEILPEHIIDQIKAGEVLERPASLLKELIENSLDAGSTEIHVQLVENGMDLISIEDNGHGISFNDLPYAFLRHATSKIKSFDDIYRLHSFGFRGEALASLAASARVTCTTQPKDLSIEGGKIIISGGKTDLLIAQNQNSHGTSLYIRDLFFNTPARLKFIKSKVSEKASIKKLLNSFLLANPHVSFSIKWDEKDKEFYKAVAEDNHMERVRQVFFSKKSDHQLFFQQQEYDGYRVRVYFTDQTYTSPQYRHHYLFVNDRFFQDKSLHSAVLRNLERFWRHGESGYYLVLIDTPPADIDVNVHPNKTHIKFMRADVIYSLLVTSLKNAIKEHFEMQPQNNPMNFFGTLAQKEQDQFAPSHSNMSNNASEEYSFFSKEQKQDFDMMNFNQDMDSLSDYSNLFNQSSALNSNSSDSQNRLIKINERFMIYRNPKSYLIDIEKLFISYLLKELDLFIRTDGQAGPLLISEPFKVLKGKIDKHYEDLKLLGFEFDRLNNEFIVLRTIPDFIPQIMLSSVASELIHYFNQPKVNQFEIEKFAIFTKKNNSPYDINNLPMAFIENLLNKSLHIDYAIELNNENMLSLFKI